VWKGVCGGVAETLGVEPVVVRLGVVALACLQPLAVLIAYVVVAHVMPVRAGAEYVAPRRARGTVSPALLGWVAIGVGGLFLLHRVATLFHPGVFIAVIAIVAGFTLLNRRRG
jgi:phage shock protein PspC (stress-responsive transcriptional regulator)